MRRFLAAFLLAVLLLPSFCIAASAAGPTVTYRVGSQEITESITVGSDITLPEAPASALGTRTFIGWATGGQLYAAGATYRASGSVVFEAVSIDLRTMTGAAVSLAGEATLRFDGAVDKAGYERLAELVGASNLKLGVLVARYKEVYGGTRVFTHASTAQSLRDRSALPFSFSTETHRFFSGRTDAISNTEILEKQAGRAYITVNIGGTPHTYYATFDPNAHARTVHGVSAFAFEDRSAATPQGRYSEAAMQALKSRLDRVVNVDQATGMVCDQYSHNNFEFQTYYYYTSPYRVSELREEYPTKRQDTYVIVGKDGGDFRNICAYFIGGSYRAPYGDECEDDGYYIWVYNETN